MSSGSSDGGAWRMRRIEAGAVGALPDAQLYDRFPTRPGDDAEAMVFRCGLMAGGPASPSCGTSAMKMPPRLTVFLVLAYRTPGRSEREGRSRACCSKSRTESRRACPRRRLDLVMVEPW